MITGTTFAINSSEAGAPPRGAIPRLASIRQNQQIVGRNDDVSRKHHFDADRKDNPRNRGDNGLPTLVRQAEWIEISDLRALAATIEARWICEQAHHQLKEERA